MSPMLTPLQPGDAIEAIAEAYELEVGGEIPGVTLLCLSAQSALETRQWKACWCFNFGNIRGTGDAGSTAIRGANEVINGKVVTYPEGFAAYSSKLAGARAYVSLLNRKYPAAMAAAALGNLDGFVACLKAGGYFTADERAYDMAEHSEAEWLGKLSEMQVWLQGVS